MSKSKYLKASELKIRDKEKRAAIWVMKMFRNGTIKSRMTKEEPYEFFMQTTAGSICGFGDRAWCGTAACIGGWMGLKMYAKDPFHPNRAELEAASLYVSGSGEATPLFPLFYNDMSTKRWPSQAADAIEKFLTTGVAE